MLPIRILLVEDSFEHQQIFSEILTEDRPHVHVDVAYNGEEFIQLAKDPGIDCFLLDYNLPDGSAAELLERAHNFVGDRPVIVMSGSDDQRVAIESFRHGGSDFIPKDQAISGDCLWQRVEAAIRTWREKREGARKAQQNIKTLLRQGETDALTGLYNRHYFMRLLSQNSAIRNHKHAHGFIMLDLDNFKQWNDTYGHAAGDRVLKTVGQLIREMCSKSDTALRWGGEEFVVLQPADSLGDCVVWAEQLRQRIEGLNITHKGQRMPITASLGVVHRKAQRLGLEIIDLADQAMYLAKRQGRNRVCTWDMVCVERRLTECDLTSADSPDAKREQFIQACSRTLGPHQLQHLTYHCEQVSKIAVELAEMLHMSAEETEQVRAAALFHDIGKSVVPESLIGKREALSADEARLLARHVEESGRIAGRLGLDAEALKLVGLHHERFDAPHNGELPLGASVLAAADAMAAMMSNRAYRQACTAEEMMREIRRHRGGQFDPQVVDAASSHADRWAAAA